MQTEFSRPSYDSALAQTSLGTEVRALSRYHDLVWYMVRRNVTLRYRRSTLGIIWTLLDPLLTMLVMTLIYGALFPRTVPGFPIFVLSGVVAWNFFSQGSQQAVSDLLGSGTLISRVALPKSIFPVVAVLTALVNLGVALAMLALLMLALRWPITPALLFVPVTMVIAGAFTLGVGLALTPLALFFRDTLNVYHILLRLLMYLSGIFYTQDHLPGLLQRVIPLVPTFSLVSIFRQPIYNGTLPDLATLLYATAWAVVMLVLGLWVFTRYSDRIAYYV